MKSSKATKSYEKCVRYYIIRRKLLHYQARGVYYINGRKLLHYRVARLLHYRSILLHYRAVITLTGDYYIIGCSTHPCAKRPVLDDSLSDTIMLETISSPLFVFIICFIEYHMNRRKTDACVNECRQFCGNR